MRQPTFTLDYLKQALQPCVYAWRRGEEWLYVGMSGLGLRRPFARHHVIGIASSILATDRLEVWVFDTPAEAAVFEGDLIRGHRPSYNSQRPAESKLPPTLTNGKERRVSLNCLVAPQTLEVVRLMAEQRGISQGVLIDWALQEQEVDATEPPKLYRETGTAYDPHAEAAEVKRRPSVLHTPMRTLRPRPATLRGIRDKGDKSR